jgi:hypothetical protein
VSLPWLEGSITNMFESEFPVHTAQWTCNSHVTIEVIVIYITEVASMSWY